MIGAGLLALSGGFMDAATYLLDGGVFANAMTGNIVLLGATLVLHDFHQALRHAVSLTAFLLGFYASRVLIELPIAHPQRLALSVEILGLLVASFLPDSFSKMGLAALVTFPVAMQVAAFRRVDGTSYNSTFMSGNLRDLVWALHDTFQPSDRAAALRQFRDLAVVCVGFFTGVVLGAFTVPHLHNHVFLIPSFILAAVLLLLRRGYLQEEGETANAGPPSIASQR